MKATDDKQKLWQDMQEHPERYSDEQLEAMMNEMDKRPDVEREWEKFVAKTHSQSSLPPRRRHWWPMAAAAVLLLVLGLYPLIHSSVEPITEPEVPSLANMTEEEQTPEMAVDTPSTVEVKPTQSPLAMVTPTTSHHKDRVPIKPNTPQEAHPDTHVQIRGKSQANNDPCYLVDGYRIWQWMLKGIDPNDVKAIYVWKENSANVDSIVALYGVDPKCGIIEITTKPEKRAYYQDFLHRMAADSAHYCPDSLKLNDRNSVRIR